MSINTLRYHSRIVGLTLVLNIYLIKTFTIPPIPILERKKRRKKISFKMFNSKLPASTHTLSHTHIRQLDKGT